MPLSAPRPSQVRIQAIDVRLYLLAGSLIDDLAPHDAAGISLPGTGRRQIAGDIVDALTQHDLNAIDALLEHHHIDEITGLGATDGNGFVFHGIAIRAPQIKTPPDGRGNVPRRT